MSFLIPGKIQIQFQDATSVVFENGNARNQAYLVFSLSIIYSRCQFCVALQSGCILAQKFGPGRLLPEMATLHEPGSQIDSFLMSIVVSTHIEIGRLGVC